VIAGIIITADAALLLILCYLLCRGCSTGIASPGESRPGPRPARSGRGEASRAYVDQTMVLESTFRAVTGTAVLTDAMAMGLGRLAPRGGRAPARLRECSRPPPRW
jgi:hypothetical protein